MWQQFWTFTIIFYGSKIPLFCSQSLYISLKWHRAINIGFHLCVGISVLSANLINFGTEKIKDGGRSSSLNAQFGVTFSLRNTQQRNPTQKLRKCCNASVALMMFDKNLKTSLKQVIFQIPSNTLLRTSCVESIGLNLSWL